MGVRRGWEGDKAAPEDWEWICYSASEFIILPTNFHSSLVLLDFYSLAVSEHERVCVCE